MAANFKQVGSTIEWTNGGTAKASGDVVVVGDLVGILATDIGAGAKGTVHIDGGFEVPCKSADAITQGMRLDWDASASEFVATVGTAASGDNVHGAVAVAAAGSGVTTVEARLLPGVGATT